MKIVFTDGNDSKFVSLCHELDEYLSDIVGSEKQKKQYSKYNTLEDIQNVALAIENDQAVSCGGFKEYEPTTAEIKRVFTKEGFRNRGYSKSIIKALESKALDKGYTRLILETGILLKEAQQMYTRMGFHIIPNYGQYINMPESICMEKSLV